MSAGHGRRFLELPWLALHPAGEWVGDQLRFDKRPLLWCYRPLTWPVWNHEHRRLARFWSAAGGLDTTAIDALRSRWLDHLAVVEPSDHELTEQLREELAVSRRRLRTVLPSYCDHDWRRPHKGDDESPEDHLWRAATAVTDISDALDELRGESPEPASAFFYRATPIAGMGLRVRRNPCERRCDRSIDRARLTCRWSTRAASPIGQGTLDIPNVTHPDPRRAHRLAGLRA